MNKTSHPAACDLLQPQWSPATDLLNNKKTEIKPYKVKHTKIEKTISEYPLRN